MKLCYLSILAEPGTYEPSLYDSMDGGDNECIWIENTFGHLPGLTIQGYRVALGEAVPDPGDGDLFILGGSYNSVHDGFPWQAEIYRWLDKLRASGKPLLAICGGHQMICHMQGIPIEHLPGGGFIAGTEAVTLSEDGLASPLMAGLGPMPRFQFGNQEHVTRVPTGARLLASHERSPVAALDYGGGWFSTQFHPEAMVETLKVAWRLSHPEYMKNYSETQDGFRLINNFVTMFE